MSMLPFFPSLKPPLLNSIWFNADAPCDDETELREMERKHRAWVEAIEKTGADLNPIGRVLPLAGTGNDTDDEDANEESDDVDSQDDEESEEIVEINNTNESNPDPDHDSDTDNIEFSTSATQDLQTDITNGNISMYGEDTN